MRRWLKSQVLGFLMTSVAVAIATSAISQEGKTAPPLPADAADLTKKYLGATERASAPLTALKKSYVSQLKKLKVETHADGDLKSALLVDQELERVATKEPGRKSALEKMATLQRVYYRYAESKAPRVYIEKGRIENAYIDGLEELVSSYTQKGDLPTAIAITSEVDKSKDRLRKWKRLAAVGTTADDPFELFDWKKLGEIIRSNQLTTSEHIGGSAQTNETTRDLQPVPSVLIGFDLHMGAFGSSKETVRRIVPLYRTETDSLVEGIARAGATGDRRRRVLAKEGYVVSGVTTVSEAGVRKMKIAFQRLEGMKTVERDKYETEWYGDWKNGREASLETKGKIPVGVDGWVGRGTGETWLILADPKE